MHFVIFYPYDTPSFKTTVLRLVSKEGLVKRLLLLNKRLIIDYIRPMDVKLRRAPLDL